MVWTSSWQWLQQMMEFAEFHDSFSIANRQPAALQFDRSRRLPPWRRGPLNGSVFSLHSLPVGLRHV